MIREIIDFRILITVERCHGAHEVVPSHFPTHFPDSKNAIVWEHRAP